jgi:stage II sporulation protein D
MMKKWVSLRFAAIVLVFIVAGMVLSQIACPGPEQRLFRSIVHKYRSEPRITVFIKETGEKKEMPIEEYLTGVVAGEMQKDWPIEAYAAQAIVARTFTMDFLARGGTRKLHGTDVSTDEEEAQAYNAEAITPAVRKAVNMTKGKVMSYKKRFVRGWFSASCGGRTALAKEGLAFKEKEPPYMKSVTCPCPQHMPKEELFWEAVFSPTEIATVLKQMGKDVETVQKVEISGKSRAGRAVALQITGSKGRTKVAGADLRIALDAQKMRSIWLTSLENRAEGVQMKGRGFGHGVGLCQWGAKALAEKGEDPEQIVKHYYPKVKIQDIW